MRIKASRQSVFLLVMGLVIIAFGGIVYSLTAANLANTAPSNNSVVYDEVQANYSFQCTYTAGGSEAPVNMSILMNVSSGAFKAVANVTMADPQSGTPQNMTVNISNVTAKVDGSYGWKCAANFSETATDDVYINSSAINVIWLDTTAPTASGITSMKLGGYSTAQDNGTVNDTTTTVEVYFNQTLEFNFGNYTLSVINLSSMKALQNISATNISNTTINASSLPPNTSILFRITACEATSSDFTTPRCTDDVAGNDTTYILDSDIGSIEIQAYANNTFLTNGANATINFTASDANLRSCAFYFNSSGDISNSLTEMELNLSKTAEIGVVADGKNRNFSWGISVADGNYSIRVGCTDAASYSRNSSTWNIIFDSLSPSSNLLGIATTDNYTFAVATAATRVVLNWSNATGESADGAKDTNFREYNLQIANSSDFADVSLVVNTSITDWTNTSYNVSSDLFSSDKAYHWMVITYDLAGNSNTSLVTGESDLYTNLTFTIDGSVPIINHSSPPTGIWLNNDTDDYMHGNDGDGDGVGLNLSFTPADGNISACIIHIGTNTSNFDQDNTTNTTVSNNVLIAYNITDTANAGILPDGNYTWNVWCNDSAGQTAWMNDSGNFTFFMDRKAPTLATPINISVGGNEVANNTLINTLTPTMNWLNVSEANFANYSVQCCLNATCQPVGGALNSTSAAVNDVSTTSVAIGAVANDNSSGSSTYYCRVVARDKAENINVSSDTVGFRVDATAPTMDLLSGTDVSATNTLKSDTVYITTNTVILNLTVNEQNPSACELWTNISGTWAVTYENLSLDSEDMPQDYTTGNFNMTAEINASGDTTITNTSYIWNVMCNDSATDTNEGWLNSSANFTFFVSTDSAPTIASPDNNSMRVNRLINFTVVDTGTAGINQSSINVTVGLGDDGVNSSFQPSVCNAITNGFDCTYRENDLRAGAGGNLIRINARDNAGQNQEFHLNITTSAAENQNLTLVSGWNLVSTPLILENSSLDDVLAGAPNNNVSKVYYYDGSSWTTWYKEAADTLTTIVPLRGYWMYAETPIEMQLYGNLTSGVPSQAYGLTNPLELTADNWYLIGYYNSPISEATVVDNALNELCAGTCSSATAYFDSIYRYDKAAATTTSIARSIWDTEEVFNTTEGFWIRMNAADTLIDT